LSACHELKFTEAQPSWKSDKKSFPKNIRGTYLNDGKQAIVIGKYQATLLNADKDVFMGLDLKTDTVKFRKWKKQYFVNINLSIDDHWSVYVLESSNDSLSLSYFDEGIEILERITPVMKDYWKEGEFNYLVNPSRSEFEEMMDLMIFTRKKYPKFSD